MSIRVSFQPSGIDGGAPAGELLLETARRLGARIGASCGGRGKCRSCAIRLEGDHLPEASAPDREVFSAAELESGWRRACQTRISQSCRVHVSARTHGAAVMHGQAMTATRVGIAEPVAASGLGLAVDLGTTNLAASLIDLETGAVVAQAALENPQAIYGGDVISRGGRALRDPEAAGELRRLAVTAIAALAHTVTGGRPETVHHLAVVGNSVMQHLLLGLAVEGLVKAPYRPLLSEAHDRPAEDFGLAPGARLHVGPNIAGFVGSDHVAALLDVLDSEPQGCWALLDIGTNTEISLFRDGRLVSASCPSGPAFEGGALTCGMRAAPGAVERVRIHGDRADFGVIGDADPVGLCGSGVLSLMAELRKAGIVDRRGRLGGDHPLVRERGHVREVVLAGEAETGGPPVTFTQADIRNVQLAKAAIRAGLDLMLEHEGIGPAALDRVLVAGAFGKYIDLGDAVAIGMLPDLEAGRFSQLGNAAGAGVGRMLACHGARRRAGEIARTAHHLDLGARPDFQKRFIARMGL
ncbi:ferredoxin [Paramagnetospirillum caucaseum]|uniref:Ferredoxin n=1 Tax=Paramagnetospirillum caucaseum TaxID=1244869 RepID=M2Z5P9_9PROT|nr:ASKHA domain-containing protein [Paramagnetospirillum caucaseum]EME69625.1 ferredoxin [Paramagnetospirillum caucaseum]